MLPITDRAKARLLESAVRANPQARFDPAGYAVRLEDNLIPGVTRATFEDDFRAGAGRELDGKMRAAHSSSALAVNSFSPWKFHPAALSLGSGSGSFESLRFEAVFPTGLIGTPPHLDLMAYGPSPVAVESKCLEYLTPKTPLFSAAYDCIRDQRRYSPWFGLIERVRRDPRCFQYLDAAQLVKHAIGLLKSAYAQNVRLLYLFWEPLNAADFGAFQSHRCEIESLQACLGDARPSLHVLTYNELWKQWRSECKAPWVSLHLERLDERYSVAV
jgi:hypothetical protein